MHNNVMRRCLLTLGLLFFSLIQSLPVAADMDFEAKLKSAYIINFIDFVSWNDGKPVVRLCLSNNAEIYQDMKGLEQYQFDDGRVLSIVTKFDDLSTCDIYYYDHKSYSEAINLNDYTHVLSISDSQKALAEGAYIQFFVRNLKLRFGINTQRLKQSSFKISSKLLRLSRQID